MKGKARLLRRRWESWNESAGPGLQSQRYSGLLGTGDLIANFRKQPPIFKYWQEIKTVWLLDIFITPFKLSGPVLRILENYLKHICNFVHTERDSKNIRWTQLKTCASLSCVLPSPGVKRMTILYRRHPIKLTDGRKQLSTVKDYSQKFNLITVSKGLIVSMLFWLSMFPHQPDCVASWKERSAGISKAAEFISITLFHSPQGIEVCETRLLWARAQQYLKNPCVWKQQPDPF